jgi:Ser/Thr protein kinase RdoA (MazF antagonist)
LSGAAAAPNDAAEIQTRVLPAYAGWAGAAVTPLPGGLVNRTYLVEADGRRAVLQRVSAVFSPAIQDNIQAVTARLAAAGLVTPRLIAADDGRLWLPAGQAGAEAGNSAGVWRMQTFVAGKTFDVVGGPAQARAAGALIARFHRALDGLPHTFVGLRGGVHDTRRHLQRLDEALAAHPDHRLWTEVAALAAEIRAGAARLPPLPELPPRIGHGDLKFNNVLFAGAAPPDSERALCLIDLDTVGPQSLAFELGDAWRSWCNRAGEDTATAALDLEIFRASLDGYRDGWGGALDPDTRRGLLLGVEWVSLELAARFAADALAESYFGWDPSRFPGRGEHNLLRARGQWSLHAALTAARGARAALLDLSPAI